MTRQLLIEIVFWARVTINIVTVVMLGLTLWRMSQSDSRSVKFVRMFLWGVLGEVGLVTLFSVWAAVVSSPPFWVWAISSVILAIPSIVMGLYWLGYFKGD
jgi:hypothetical protein